MPRLAGRKRQKGLAYSPGTSDVKPPPMWMVRINVAMLRRGLRIGSQYLLSVRGRKSGVVRSTPISIVTIEGSRYIVAAFSDAAWVQKCAQWEQAQSRAGGTSNRCVLSSCRSESASRFCELSFSRSGAASASSGQAIQMSSWLVLIAIRCFASTQTRTTRRPSVENLR